MSESACTTTPSTPEVFPSTGSVLPDGYSVLFPDAVPAMSLDRAALVPLPLPPAHAQQFHWAHPVVPIPPPHELFLSDSDDGHIPYYHTPFIPASPKPGVPISHRPAPYSRSPSPSPFLCGTTAPPPRSRSRSPSPLYGVAAPSSQSPSPPRFLCGITPSSRSPSPPRFLCGTAALYEHRISRPYTPVGEIPFEEEEDHFIRRSQQWDANGMQWVPRNRFLCPPPASPRDIYDYFYLNIRSTNNGDTTSLVFSDFTPVLNSLLRTVFNDLNRDTPLEYPIHRLFQKMDVLRSRLDDIRDILDAEHVQEDLITMAGSFGFKASSGCDTAIQYFTELATHLGKLLEVVETECKEQAEEFEEALANNQISFDLLEYYYEEGCVYAYYDGIGHGDLDIQRHIIPMVFKRACFSDDKKRLDLDVEYHEWDGVCFQKRVTTLVQYAYKGARQITSLIFYRMSEETLAKVIERGRRYLSYCRLGVVYAKYYDGTRMQDQLECSDSNVKARVRQVMIDPLGFHLAQRGYNPNLRGPLPDNTEEYLARLPYWIGGYDLETHVWQTFHLSDLMPIEYDEMVWRNLIMDVNTKDLIEALVDSTGQSLGASYSGQLSKGKNVLLIGPLGTGRMTTVHAVCNLLKRPLLTISAYDIRSGTDVIAHWMSLAVTWNAVIVVKDADGYLKSAHISDREYINATLRQLEGDDCITFWVTSGCDEELLSSFCAVIKFPELNATARCRLWLTHFGQPEPTGYVPKIERTLVSSYFCNQKKVDYSAHLRDIEKLSRHRLDGRTIENIVRSARALANSNGEHLSVHHVKVVMEARRKDDPPLWRKLTRVLMLVTKVLHASGAN